MDINVKRDGARSIVYVSGDIDLYTSPQLRETVLDLFQKRNQERVILNLKDVHYIDSSGIASLVEGLQEAKKTKARFILVGLNEAPRHVLELTRLLNVFEVVGNEEEAAKD
jgi:anti-sigma B factor antagonist